MPGGYTEARGWFATGPVERGRASMPPVPPDLRAVRALLPCLTTEVYLNTGGCGPLSRPAADALGAWAQAALRRGRGSAEGFGRIEAESVALRAAAGRVVGDDGERVALTANTTDGLNTVAWGLDWRPGDEIVMPALEYPGTAVLLATVARRRGATLRLIDPDGVEEDLEAAVAEVSGPRTRLVVLSHVSWATGAVLDVAGAARAARRVGAAVAVDGAQSAGAVPVDVAALGVDAYAFPAHKWLLGPEGLGALWVAPDAAGTIDLTRSGFESGRDHTAQGGLTLHPGARRYEAATLPAALLPAWRATIAWLDDLGWGWVHRRIAEAQAAARAALSPIPGVTVLTPPGPQAGLVTFTIDGGEPEAAARRLAEQGVILRWLRRPAALRASLGFFTDAADVARLAAACAAVAAGDGC